MNEGEIFKYNGILDAAFISKKIGFNPEAEYNLSYQCNGEQSFPTKIKGSELSQKLNELRLFWSYG